jgi:hypothetical protein
MLMKEAQKRQDDTAFREGENVPGSATLCSFGAVKKMGRMKDVTF